MSKQVKRKLTQPAIPGEDENCSMAWEFGLLEKILFAQMTLLYPTGKGTDGLKRQRLCSDPFKLSWFLHRESL